VVGVRVFLVHPWRWHRKPRSLPANLARAALEVAFFGAVLVALAAWPWSPALPAKARVLVGACYGAVALATVVTMRVRRRL
jgi:hypothetical protein